MGSMDGGDRAYMTGTTNPAGFNGVLAQANGGSAQTTAIAAFDALAPTTTKGDLFVNNGSGNVRVPVGTNGQLFVVDTAQATGTKWWTITGTVTSVAVTSSTLTVTNSPQTSSGNIDIAIPLSVQGNNILINGCMQMAARGADGAAVFAVPASTTQYTMDRWQLATGANQACTVTQTAGATSGSFIAKIQRNSGQTGTGNIQFCQTALIDMCIGAASNIISISFKAYKGANYSPTSSLLNVQLITGTGTTDKSALSTFTGAAAQSTTITLTTTPTQFSFSSSALGASVTQMGMNFFMTPTSTASTDDSFYVYDIQVEIAPQPTRFQRRSLGWQQQACQYFFNKSFNRGTAPAQNVGTGTGEYYSYMRSTVGAGSDALQGIMFPGIMRVSPTITLYNPSAANAQVRNLTNSANWTACSADSATPLGLSVIGTTDVGAIAGNQLIYHWTAEGDVT